jgi:15-cis-phytoene synthase/lycopene beta-cyclase
LQSIYDTAHPASTADLNAILNTIPNLTSSSRSAFHLFSTVIPRLVPIEPFLELCQGYETDLQFYDPTTIPLEKKMNTEKFQLEDRLPIKVEEDLMEYADNVAGSIAAAICYLAWSVLDTPLDPSLALRPVDDLSWSSTVHTGSPPKSSPSYSPEIRNRIQVVEKSREMGRSLQLVNIARDVAKDAVIARIYVPLSWFANSADYLSILFPSSTSPSYATQTLPLLDLADSLRKSSEGAIGGLPPTARGGMRAMVASYFEIGEEIRRRGGEVEDKGVKVSKLRRAKAAARAMWGV